MKRRLLPGEQACFNSSLLAALAPVVQNLRFSLAEGQSSKKFHGSGCLLDVRKQMPPPGPMRKCSCELDRLRRLQFLFQMEWIWQPNYKSGTRAEQPFDFKL